jgi:hypothetical protein
MQHHQMIWIMVATLNHPVLTPPSIPTWIPFDRGASMDNEEEPTESNPLL